MTTRIAAALCLAPPFLYITYLGGWPFSVMVFGLAMLGLREYHSMIRAGGLFCQETLGQLWCLALFGAYRAAGTEGILVVVVLGPMLLLIKYLPRDSLAGALTENSHTLYGVMVFALPLLYLVAVRDLPGRGLPLTFALLCLIWVQDSAAYFWGRALGRRKFAPVISPKKTWEGAVLGLITALALTRPLLVRFLEIPVDTPFLLGLCLVAVAAQLGDLNESLVKRNLDVKDSSTLIPGHGGILDRFDSFTYAAPVMYYVVKAFGP